ncbi:MAG: RNA polymerase sigma factor [Clostridia bacterium]|nr:RNA polymerase sigma factor [Clostridia bacterium]
MTETDQENLKTLISRARKGSAEAFGELYGAYSDDMYKFALWYLKNSHDAEDAVQDCALYAYKNIAFVKKPDSFRSWLFRILANKCADITRERKKRADLDVGDIEQAFFDDYEDGSVTRLLGRLEEDDRRIVTLAVLGEFNSREISKITGLKDSTVRSKLSRSLKKLREMIQTDEEKDHE